MDIVYSVTVFDLPTGKSGKVVKMDITGPAAARLKALGLREGVEVRVLAFSLFKSGVLLGFGAVRLGMRKALARKIEVAA